MCLLERNKLSNMLVFKDFPFKSIILNQYYEIWKNVKDLLIRKLTIKHEKLYFRIDIEIEGILENGNRFVNSYFFITKYKIDLLMFLLLNRLTLDDLDEIDEYSKEVIWKILK